jgi:hypothetical protein
MNTTHKSHVFQSTAISCPLFAAIISRCRKDNKGKSAALSITSSSVIKPRPLDKREETTEGNKWGGTDATLSFGKSQEKARSQHFGFWEWCSLPVRDCFFFLTTGGQEAMQSHSHGKKSRKCKKQTTKVCSQ